MRSDKGSFFMVKYLLTVSFIKIKKCSNILLKSDGVNTARFLKVCLAIFPHYGWKEYSSLNITATSIVLYKSIEVAVFT